MKKLAIGLAGAIGSKYLKKNNQLVFTEYAGYLSKIYLQRPLDITVSYGNSVTIKGTWTFDCESGKTGTNISADLFWRQMDNVKRQMEPMGNTLIVNLGIVDFNQVTPATLQTYEYTNSPIIGNNDSTNKLVAGDVFCVLTREGNFAKIKVVKYGYDLVVDWVTYRLKPAYQRIGTGYTNVEDIVVCADETTAFVTERAGYLHRINLGAANCSPANVIAKGMTAPQQIWLDEAHYQAYVVEYANPGRLFRIDTRTGAMATLYSGLNLAVGLVLSSDLVYAYISEQGLSCISRIHLATGNKTIIATGLVNPFFLTWYDESESVLLVPERDPANRIAMVNVTKTSSNITYMIEGTAFRPSSIVTLQPGYFCVFADTEIDQYFLSVTSSNDLYKGIGYVPKHLITDKGMADTTSEPTYPFQFAKNSPFGGTLPINIDHHRAWNEGYRFYQIMVDGKTRFDTWYDLVLNPATGKYDTSELQKPDLAGFYKIHDPGKAYYNTDLGCLLSTVDLHNEQQNFSIIFFKDGHNSPVITSHQIHINNESCVAKLFIPLLGTSEADPNCGYLKYTSSAEMVNLRLMASHPHGFAGWNYNIIKGVNQYLHLEGLLTEVQPILHHTVSKSVGDFLAPCPRVAAFAETLYVYSSVINGVGRQGQYDASVTIAFCLAP